MVDLPYNSVKSRTLILLKGIIIYLPGISLWWFLIRICNISAPPSLNLVSEIELLVTSYNLSIRVIFLVTVLSFFTAVYCLYLFLFPSQLYGLLKTLNFNQLDLLNFIIHWIPLNIFILKLSFFYLWSILY
jgi:NADH:ubiquinone oxidoreductase subunit 4 (subunit M)